MRRTMEITDVEKLNTLWRKVYPYLAAHIMGVYRRDSGAVLELGPFAGGVSLELARLYPKLDITIADESPGVVEYLQTEMSVSGLAGTITVERTDLSRLAFDDARFDLIIFRGIFFFLDKKENLLREIFRVLKDGGLAFVGGGYGKGIPQEIIDEVAGESQALNERLGRRWYSIEELAELAEKSGLRDNCKIEDEGGMWLIIRRQGLLKIKT